MRRETIAIQARCDGDPPCKAAKTGSAAALGDRSAYASTSRLRHRPVSAKNLPPLVRRRIDAART